MTVQIVDGQITVTLSADTTRVSLSQAAGPQGATGAAGATGPQGDAYAPGELRSATAGDYTYLGRAGLDTDEADETWTIARFSVVDGAVVTEHATGAWTNREILSYQ